MSSSVDITATPLCVPRINKFNIMDELQYGDATDDTRLDRPFVMEILLRMDKELECVTVPGRKDNT